jgi:hypothetical protein
MTRLDLDAAIEHVELLCDRARIPIERVGGCSGGQECGREDEDGGGVKAGHATWTHIILHLSGPRRHKCVDTERGFHAQRSVSAVGQIVVEVGLLEAHRLHGRQVEHVANLAKKLGNPVTERCGGLGTQGGMERSVHAVSLRRRRLSLRWSDR